MATIAQARAAATALEDQIDALVNTAIGTANPNRRRNVQVIAILRDVGRR